MMAVHINALYIGKKIEIKGGEGKNDL